MTSLLPTSLKFAAKSVGGWVPQKVSKQPQKRNVRSLSFRTYFDAVLVLASLLWLEISFCIDIPL